MNKKKNNTLSDFCRGLKAHDHYLLSCHVSPEGDAIGSILALDSLLRRLGKKTTVVAEDEFPKRLPCLSSRRWNRVEDLRKPDTAFKAMVLADCPHLGRIGKVQSLLARDTIVFNVDHHISNVMFGHYNYVRPEASASGEVVMDIFKHFKMPLTKDEAKNLYVALSTDTGSFKYGNTTSRTHQLAAELIGKGIPVEKINEELYSTYSLNKINLYSRLLSRVKTTARGKIAWVAMRREDLHHSGATYEDTEGFIDFLRFLKEVQIAFFISELDHAQGVKVSFRSKGSYDVNKVATWFQGGGHKKASGCTLRTSVEEAEKNIVDYLEKRFHF